jgi:hypothetical protein
MIPVDNGSLRALVVDYIDQICKVGIGAEGVVLRKVISL